MMSLNEAKIEQEIINKKLNAPRLTPTMIDATIESTAYYVFPGTTLTVCCITLQNGFNVVGESAAASPENFDADIGRKIAFENARNKIWELEGYLLKQRLFEGSTK
jgi:hypothetical protein